MLELCAKHGVAILEDDWGSDMLSDGEYRPMLRMLGGKDVLYVNSFTKKLLPSLRVGFVAAAPSLVPTLVAMKRLSTLGNAWLTEAIVAEFLDRGYYDTHLHALQRALDARYAACLAALDELMPDGVRWTRRAAARRCGSRCRGRSISRARGASRAPRRHRLERVGGVRRRAAPARLPDRVRVSLGGEMRRALTG